jgi:glutathione S-transferase
MLTIYGVPLSVHTRKAIITAIHKKIDYKFEVVVPVLPGQPPANWSTLSPTGLIPVLQDGDYTLGDSTAIALYLEKKHPTPAILPTTLHEYGRALFLDAYVGDMLWAKVVHPLFVQTIVNPNIRKIPTDRAAVDSILTEMTPKIFGYLDQQVTGNYLVGDSLSLADLAVASNFIVYQYCSYTIDAGRYPKLKRYLRDIVGIDAFLKALEQEKPFVEQMGLDRGFLS